TIDTVSMSLKVITEMLPEIKFNKERMREACQSGYITATDLAEYLVKKGIPFRQAHEITGKIVLYCIQKEKALSELNIKEFKKFSKKIEKDVYTILTPEGSIDAKVSYGSTSKKSIKEQIKLLKKILKK
ncbi:MAG: argininosuccinate lyase, partial [Thermodesulfovibrio sp.]|nr:argininosuccinate lyase [Thermodesulfovibrio sp.]